MNGHVESMVIYFALLVVMMTIGWIVSVLRRNVTIVDSLWGSGFVLIAFFGYFMVDVPTEGFAGRRLLLVVLTSLWGVRLTIYLTHRNWGKPEDSRYTKWRIQSGPRFWWISLFKVFWLQAIFLWVMALPLQVGLSGGGPMHWTLLDGLGFLLWAVGFYFEAVGDVQLARFKSHPANRGKVMKSGLWSQTRHPNYFGEFLMWWGVYCIVLSTPGNWWTIISPIVTTVVLTRLTGIQLTEKTILEKKPHYRDYIRSTPAFFPRPRWMKRQNH